MRDVADVVVGSEERAVSILMMARAVLTQECSVSTSTPTYPGINIALQCLYGIENSLLCNSTEAYTHAMQSGLIVAVRVFNVGRSTKGEGLILPSELSDRDQAHVRGSIP